MLFRAIAKPFVRLGGKIRHSICIFVKEFGGNKFRINAAEFNKLYDNRRPNIIHLPTPKTLETLAQIATRHETRDCQPCERDKSWSWFFESFGGSEKWASEFILIMNDWTSKGGYFRFSDSLPTKWTHIDGKWIKKDLVPFGKVNEKYKQDHWNCPKCNKQLTPSETEYMFICEECNLAFSWAWGKLKQVDQLDSYYIDDF